MIITTITIIIMMMIITMTITIVIVISLHDSVGDQPGSTGSRNADRVQVRITSALQGWQAILFTAAQVPSESSPHRALRAHPQTAA